MSTLVTGGAGFIGSHVAEECIALGQDVVVLDDLSGGFLVNVPKGAQFVQGSITDPAIVASLFGRFRFEYVYHLAAYAAEGLSHFIRRYNYLTNVLGSVTLINESVTSGVKCFVFASSIAVYGETEPPVTELSPVAPIDPYGIAKYAVEQDLHCAHDAFGLDYVVFRPHNVYGERQNLGDPFRNVVGILLNQALTGKRMTIFGDGLQTRAFTHIADVAPVIARSVGVARARNEVFNIGSDVSDTVLTVATEVAAALKVAPDFEFLPPRREALHVYASHAKARELLQFGPTIGLREGIRRMAAWAKERGPMVPRPFTSLEVSLNLPAGWGRWVS